MKRCLTFILLIFTAVFACAVDLDYAHLDNFDKINKNFFQNFIDGEQATYSIYVDKKADGTDVIEKETAKRIFADAFNRWMSKVEYYILRNEERKAEFADILNIVNRGYINLTELPNEGTRRTQITTDASLLVIFAEPDQGNLTCGESAACFLNSGVIVLMIAPKFAKEDYTNFLTHELGHAFGLADQYSGQTFRSSFRYNSQIVRPSIMGISEKITCDDIDGLITTIDRLKGTSREFYSLCEDGLFIQAGSGVLKDNKEYEFTENYRNFDADIKVSAIENAPSAFVVDMTLYNFALTEEGLSIVRNMGFQVNDYNTLKKVKVEIHGSVVEMETKLQDITYMKTPIGLWTSVLSVKRGHIYRKKQMVSQEFFTPAGNEPIFTDLSTNEPYIITEKLTLPIIGEYPTTGHGEKESIREIYNKNHNPFVRMERKLKNMANIMF